MKIKALTILLLWATIGATVTYGVQHTALRIALIFVAVWITIHISLIRKRKLENI